MPKFYVLFQKYPLPSPLSSFSFSLTHLLRHILSLYLSQRSIPPPISLSKTLTTLRSYSQLQAPREADGESSAAAQRVSGYGVFCRSVGRSIWSKLESWRGEWMYRFRWKVVCWFVSCCSFLFPRFIFEEKFIPNCHSSSFNFSPFFGRYNLLVEYFFFNFLILMEVSVLSSSPNWSWFII